MTALVEASETTVAGRPEEVLRQAASGTGAAALSSHVIDHVAEPAQGLMAALRIRAVDARRVWVSCPHVRSQELIHHDLALWGIPARFFPEVEFSGFEDALPDPDVAAERLEILHHLAGDEPLVVVVSAESWDDVVPVAAGLKQGAVDLKIGERLDLAGLMESLDRAGYERAGQVYHRGQFAVRGGIVDVFGWNNVAPLRVELFDDEIESIREFDVDEQTSVRRLESASLALEPRGEEAHGRLSDYVGADDLLISIDGELKGAAFSIYQDAAPGRESEDFSTACFADPVGVFDAGDFVLQEVKRTQFVEQIASWNREGWGVNMFFHTTGEQERFAELVDVDFLETGAIRPVIGDLNRGFTVPAAKLAVLSDAELFGRYKNLRTRRLAERGGGTKRVSGEAELRKYEEGDFVVHQDYGIGRFLEVMEKDGQEVLVLEFAEKAKLYVPVDQAHLVSRYVGVGKAKPTLTKLGDGKWSRTKEKAHRSIMEYAEHLLSVQAERATLKAYAHTEDTRWQWEFEHSFLYRETPDQLTAIDEAKRDMESEKPMDRLVCGDVGFGKTEVAIRAAFKAVMSGRQVAVLVPTTVLAQQHYQTFRERMSDYPVTIDLLSRYRTPRQQRETVRRLASGGVDIVIGTHRLISKDIAFKSLGLVVIDEEQRFGVKHKERFKELFRLVDVLTLSATPIPRTLYLSLLGVKDMSTIETPPPNRIPVATTICPYDERVMRMAIERELKRGGQVYVLHNRVKTIHGFAEKIGKLCPKARVIVGHGQMEEGELEDVMTKFVAQEYDVLVATTIIESGIDIPNANTIIIDRADRFGLADLYQLRGRVGRAQNKAYAILMIPRDMLTVGDARKRIGAIKQYTALGSGFRIAMRDLEIRGAGNLLGTQQSGHIAAVGFDLYCKLLRKSVAKLKGQRVATTVDVTLSLDFVCNNEAEFTRHPDGRIPAFIPSTYMVEARERIAAYRELSEVGTIQELNRVRGAWEDRFGRKPEAVEHLFRCTELRTRLAQKHVTSCEVKGDKLMLSRHGHAIQMNGKFPRLEAGDPAGRLVEAVDWAKRL